MNAFKAETKPVALQTESYRIAINNHVFPMVFFFLKKVIKTDKFFSKFDGFEDLESLPFPTASCFNKRVCKKAVEDPNV
jgi:hypothetical protein